MSYILSVSTKNPPYVMDQSETMNFAHEFFKNDFNDIERLLQVFDNSEISRRYFSAPIDWFKEKRGFADKNDRYCEMALDLSIESIKECLTTSTFLNQSLSTRDIDAIIFISTTGLATPSIDARIMNQLDFNPHTKRLPIWGLGCAGGTAGLARADDYCSAHPEACVLVIGAELCSLTFQYNDRSKSNLIGVSLFADGVATALVVGEHSHLLKHAKNKVLPRIIGSESSLLKNSEEVMGWQVTDEGLNVVFSKSIPSLIASWFKPVTDRFLQNYDLDLNQIAYFIAHPGGRKVLEAYENHLSVSRERLEDAWYVLKHYGNMSSPTVLFVLNKVMAKSHERDEIGLAASLGPGFSAEHLLIKWETYL